MKTRSIVLLVVLGIGGVFVASVGCCSGVAILAYRGYRSTEAAVSPKLDEMFRAIEADRFGETYESETTPELRQTATKEKYEQIGRTVKTRLGSLQAKSLVQFNARQMNADTYTDVVYRATFEKGTGTIKARLKKSGGEWKFVSFHIDSPEFLKDLSTANCPKCGQPHAADARFCPACGADMTKPAAGEPPDEPASSEEKANAQESAGSPDP